MNNETTSALVDISGLPVELQPKAQEIAVTIDLDDRQGVLQYGVAAQRKISDFAETVLTEIRNKDGGYAGEILSNLVTTVKDLDVQGITGEPGVMGKMFGGMKRKIQRFLRKYESMASQVDKVVRELEQARMNLLRDITILDDLHRRNGEYLQELDLFIAAGKYRLHELRREKLPVLEVKAQESKDPVDAQRVQDFNQLLNSFEKKLHDMQLSRMVAIQASPQIRLIQGNNEILVEKIQNSILTTIPLWKSQIVIAVSLFRQGKAIALQREVTNTTNEMLRRNAEMLKQGSLDVARETERGIVDVETLQKVNTDLISTIEETLKIQKEGREQRQAAEVELQRMEGQLRERLISIEPSAR